MHSTHMADSDRPELFRTSVVLSRTDLRKLRVIEAQEDKGRDELIRELIAQRVANVRLEVA